MYIHGIDPEMGFLLIWPRMPTHVEPPFGLEGVSGNPAPPTYIFLLPPASMENIHAISISEGRPRPDFLRPLSRTCDDTWWGHLMPTVIHYTPEQDPQSLKGFGPLQEVLSPLRRQGGPWSITGKPLVHYKEAFGP